MGTAKFAFIFSVLILRFLFGDLARRALKGYDSFHGTTYSQGGLPRNPDAVLNLLAVAIAACSIRSIRQQKQIRLARPWC